MRFKRWRQVLTTRMTKHMRFVIGGPVGVWRNGGARALGARGCGFESHRPDQTTTAVCRRQHVRRFRRRWVRRNRSSCRRLAWLSRLDRLDRQPGRLPGAEPTVKVARASEPQVSQRCRGNARRVAIRAHQDDLSLRIGQACILEPRRRVEPPVQDGQRHMDRSGNGACRLALLGAARIDHQRAGCRCPLGGVWIETLNAGAGCGEEIVDGLTIGHGPVLHRLADCADVVKVPIARVLPIAREATHAHATIGTNDRSLCSTATDRSVATERRAQRSADATQPGTPRIHCGGYMWPDTPATAGRHPARAAWRQMWLRTHRWNAQRSRPTVTCCSERQVIKGRRQRGLENAPRPTPTVATEASDARTPLSSHLLHSTRSQPSAARVHGHRDLPRRRTTPRRRP